MAAKGTIREDHMPVNKYRLQVIGLPPITFTKVSGIEEELETVDLPDRTKASGGNTGATSFDFEAPMHHEEEITALETWYREGRDPVSPTYKKAATLSLISGSDTQVRSYALTGCFITKRALPDLEMSNEGEMASWMGSMSVDSVDPI